MLWAQLTCSVGKRVLIYSTALKSALSRGSWLGNTWRVKGGKKPNNQQHINFSFCNFMEHRWATAPFWQGCTNSSAVFSRGPQPIIAPHNTEIMHMHASKASISIIYHVQETPRTHEPLIMHLKAFQCFCVVWKWQPCWDFALLSAWASGALW